MNIPGMKRLILNNRCCLYVSKLEHDFFGKNQNLPLPKVPKKDKKKEVEALNQQAINECKLNQERLKLAFSLDDEDEDTW